MPMPARLAMAVREARRVLGWQPHPAEQTLLDCARSLIDLGTV